MNCRIAYRVERVSPVEVTRAVLARIQICEPKLNAMYIIDGEGALVQAAASETRWREGRPLSPLDGVPITIKDIIYAIALVLIEGRFIMGVTGWEQLGVEIVQAIIWSCLAMSVLVGDLANHWAEIRSALSAPARQRVPAKQSAPDEAVEAT